VPFRDTEVPRPSVPNTRNSTSPELAPSHEDDGKKSALVERILRGELSPELACEQQAISRAELGDWVRVYRWAARRAIDAQVIEALSAQGLGDLEHTQATEFSGGLESMAVSDLVQTIQYGRKDAHIRIAHGTEQSHIWCAGGEIVDAQSIQLSGSAAVYRLMALHHGQVHADFSPVSRTRTIHASTQALLLESAKRSDECRQLRERIGDTRAVYVVSASAPADAPLEPALMQVLAAFDGARSVDEVVHTSSFPDLETLVLISRLLDESWLVPRPTPLRKPAPARVTSAQRHSLGSFLPTAVSWQAHPSSLPVPRRRLWASAAGGVAVVACAFGVGFLSARNPGSTQPAALGPALRKAEPCPSGLSLVAGRFCLGVKEVSAGEYQSCVSAGACESLASESGEVDALSPARPAYAARDEAVAVCNGGRVGREQYPVNCITYPQARRFCEWRGERLPSAAEWELAAQPRNSEASGIIDLLGGVSEWTSAGTGPESVTSGVDAVAQRERFVVLGGSLKSDPAAVAAPATRLYMNANASGRNVGFRCAKELP
jgi:formylglycine-generating enzyme required for sulfatase activity